MESLPHYGLAELNYIETMLVEDDITRLLEMCMRIEDLPMPPHRCAIEESDDADEESDMHNLPNMRKAKAKVVRRK